MATKPLRHLTIGYAERAKELRQPPLALALGVDQPPSGLEPLRDGHQKLYSYFRPGLSGGTHEVSVEQTIIATKDGVKQRLENKSSRKIFTVESPRYQIPEGCVHSANPAEGEKAPSEMLPSLVFTDPHLPWERAIPSHSGLNEEREAMPWIALLVFEHDEVHIAAEHTSGPGSIFRDTQVNKKAEEEGKPVAQSATATITMSLADLNVVTGNGGGGIVCPIPIEDKNDHKTMLDVVFVRPRLFNDLVATFENGKPKTGQKKPDLSRYKYLSHVRHVKTEGMATSGGEESKGLFSVVLSHRLGPLSQDEQRVAIAHLVSLEGWMEADLTGTETKYVALNSLYSWTYTAMPMRSFNLTRGLQFIGDHLHVLRAPEEMITRVEENKAPIAPKLSQRLKDGYTLKKYRIQTGEVTTAFFRGPLLPSVPRHPFAPKWTSMSNSGINLQILDPDTGMLDITYSAAWNLGKSLALADSVFTTALTRLRKLVLSPSLNSGKKMALRSHGAFVSKTETLSTISDSLSTLKALANRENGAVTPAPATNRWKVTADLDVLDLALSNPSVKKSVMEVSLRKARKLAGSLGDAENDQEYVNELFNELNKPLSSDWRIVISWVLDRMFLFGIPSQYLIVDQEFLPQESLRFFYIDPNWIDALIDGALSLANTIGKDDDFVRRAIKSAINVYLDKEDPEIGFKPQIPSYGLLFRSDIISQYPDIHIEAPVQPSSDHQGAPILRHEIISKGLLLCLFDRSPATNDLSLLKFTQPPHQQTFAAGMEITPDHLDMRYKRAYSLPQTTKDLDYGTLAHRTIKLDGSSGPKLFFWGENSESRLLLMDAWTEDVLRALSGPGGMLPTEFNDTLITSAMVGVQLGTPVYQLSIRQKQSQAMSKLAAASPMRAFTMLHPTMKPAPIAPMRVVKMRKKSLMPNLLGIEVRERAPHLQIVSPLISIQQVGNLDSMSGVAETGCYDYMIGPIDADIKEFGKLSYTGKPEDLVFSIVRQDRGGEAMFPPYDLMEILITLKLGKPISKLNLPSNLMSGYDGPGPTMLSNLRYNVLTERNETELVLRIVSRSPRGSSVAARVKECSFLLPLVKVHALTQTKKIRIEFEEKYVMWNDKDPTKPRPLNPVTGKFYVELQAKSN